MAKAPGVIGLFPRFSQPFLLKLAYSTYIGGWSPFRMNPPVKEAGWPRSIWDGEEETGKHIANRRFTLAGCDISFSRSVGWYSKEGSLEWLRALHRFDWMKDVQAFNDGKPAAKLLRKFVWEWIACSERVHPCAGEPDVLGARLANWMAHGHFLLDGARNTFRRKFLHSTVIQVLSLRRSLRRGDTQFGINAIKGMLFVALTLPGCGIFYKEAMRLLHRHVAVLTGSGAYGHAMNPTGLHADLRSLIDIYYALKELSNREDARVAEAVAHLAGILEHVQHGDEGFALFHGSAEGDAGAITQTLQQSSEVTRDIPTANKRRTTRMTPTTLMDQSGFARIEAGNTVVIVDTDVPEPGSRDAYFSTLAFEMSHGKNRYVVNCGAFIGNDPAWGRVVKTTAAHSTVCIDDRNSCQLHGSHNGDNPFEVERRVVEREGYQFFEGVYNGYALYSGLVHARQLLINESGTRFSGADHLTVLDGYGQTRSHDVNLRFHLHPDLHVRRLMNGMVVLTSQGEDEEWVFHSSVGQAVELEESIYLGKYGKPLATQQIVIYAPYAPDEVWSVEWSFIKS